MRIFASEALFTFTSDFGSTKTINIESKNMGSEKIFFFWGNNCRMISVV